MIILDTNVVSELVLPVPNQNVSAWVDQQSPRDFFLTAISEAELRYGIELLPEGRRRDALLAGIEDMLHEDFAGRVLPFNRAAARAYASIAAERRASGRPIGEADCQIAAIARSLGASVATRDSVGFQGCGIEVIDPWADG
jgi:hypothetical protein